jgi:hypothetical protein
MINILTIIATPHEMYKYYKIKLIYMYLIVIIIHLNGVFKYFKIYL